MSSLAFEKVGVLFNIAALQSAIAAVQSNAESDEGLKKAAIFFQQSAGIFNHLKSSAPALGQEPTPDLNPETLNVLSNLMLAQAQEIFVFKAIKDGMKDLIIAKLSNQAVDMYGDVLKAMQKESLKTLWDKEWIPTVAGKVSGFQALTLLFQAAHLNSTKKIGECISLLGKSIETFKTAQSRMGKPSYLDEYAKRAQRNLVDAKKENEFIYNASIPNADTVESPGKAQLAKAMPLTPPLNSNFKDLFNDLVPVALQQALNMCDGQKAEIVGAEVRNLRDSTQTLNGVLSSLNLPAAIEVAQPGSSLPPSLLEKANEVREKGGIDSIRKLIEDLPESLTRNQEILDETEKMLNEEEQSDNQLRNQFKEKWTRTKSESLNGMFRTSVTKYREIINNAVAADKVVRQKFENNSRYIELLSKSPSELHAAIPAGGENVQSSSAVIKLRHLMESVETIKAERDVIESELKSATVDLKSQFLSALAADGAVDPQLVISEVGKSLNPLQKQVAESKARQETLISDIQQAHQQFTAESGAGSNQRDQILSHLATAYDTFTELQHNLKEGTKFYNDLTQLLIVFQSKVSDFCFARKTEKEELMKDLTAESSRQAAGNAPSIPSHHGEIFRKFNRILIN
jgi:programmed cell death 6-interacting protein